jgi:hypothetical protein
MLVEALVPAVNRPRETWDLALNQSAACSSYPLRVGKSDTNTRAGLACALAFLAVFGVQQPAVSQNTPGRSLDLASGIEAKVIEALFPLKETTPMVSETLFELKGKVQVRIKGPRVDPIIYFAIAWNYAYQVEAVVTFPARSPLLLQLQELKGKFPDKPLDELVHLVAITRQTVTGRDRAELTKLARFARQL